MSIEIRAAEQDEAPAYLRAVLRGFHEATVDERDVELRVRRFLPGRWLAAHDGGQIVSTVRSIPLATTLPGGATPVSCGITSVTTAATHRRRGLMADLLVRVLREGRDAGEPLTTLIAAEWPIYGRFGFGVACDHATYHLDASSVRFTADGSGRVELVTAEAFEAEAPAVYDRHRRRSPGEIERDALSWQVDAHGTAAEPFKGFFALCRNDDGAVTGYVRYTIKVEFDQRRPNATLEVQELIGDSGAELALWRYVAGVDWVTRVVAEVRSVGERLPWWVHDGRHVRMAERADHVWARPLDVPACLTARTYAAPLDAVIGVVDPIGLSGGRWRLVAEPAGATGPGGVTCSPSTAGPDLTLPVATLGAVLFAGHPLSVLAAAGRADEHRAGAVRAATAAFGSDTVPWSSSWF